MIDRVSNLINALGDLHPAIVVIAALVAGLVMVSVLRNAVRAIIATTLIVGVAVLSMPGGVNIAKQVKAQASWADRGRCAKTFVMDADYWTGAKLAACPKVASGSSVADAVAKLGGSKGKSAGGYTPAIRTQLINACIARQPRERPTPQARLMCSQGIVPCIEKRMPASQLVALTASKGVAAQSKLKAVYTACQPEGLKVIVADRM